jgi:hypothetical protein
MEKGLTLLEIYKRDKRRKRFIAITLPSIFILCGLGLFLYLKPLEKKEQSILGEQKSEVPSTEQEEETLSNPEKDSEDTSSDETIIETEKEVEEPKTYLYSNDNTDIVSQPKDVVEEKQTEETKVDYCNDDYISSYQQTISSAQAVINNAEEYLNNPTCNYPYIPSSCTFAYYNCVNSVDTWFDSQEICSNMPRSGACASIRQEKYERLALCEEEKDYCDATCQNYILTETNNKQILIEEKKNLILENEKKLKECGI